MAGQIQGPSILRIMSGIERAIQDGRSAAIKKAALAGKVIHAAEISKASGGDSKLSGVGPKGAKVGVRFDMARGSFDPEALLKATGPMQLIESDTSGHVIRSRHATGYKRRGFVGPTLPGQFRVKNTFGPKLSPVLNIPGIGYRRSARHPGTRGKHPWQKGKDRARPVETRIMRGATWDIIKKAAKP